MNPAGRDQAHEDDDFQLIDVEQLKHSTALHAPRNQPPRRVTAWTFLAVLALAGLFLWAAPRSYGVEAEVLAQKNALMPALGNPSRAVPPDADRPTRAAAETVLRRDNLLALIKQTDLHGPLAAGPLPPLPAQGPHHRRPLSFHRGGQGERDARPAGEAAEGRDHRVDRQHLHRLAQCGPGVPARGRRPPDLPRGAPQGRGFHHRRDDHHPGGACDQPAGGNRQLDGGHAPGEQLEDQVRFDAPGPARVPARIRPARP